MLTTRYRTAQKQTERNLDWALWSVTTTGYDWLNTDPGARLIFKMLIKKEQRIVFPKRAVPRRAVQAFRRKSGRGPQAV